MCISPHTKKGPTLTLQRCPSPVQLFLSSIKTVFSYLQPSEFEQLQPNQETHHTSFVLLKRLRGNVETHATWPRKLKQGGATSRYKPRPGVRRARGWGWGWRAGGGLAMHSRVPASSLQARDTWKLPIDGEEVGLLYGLVHFVEITLKICGETEKRLRTGGLASCPRVTRGIGKEGRGAAKDPGMRGHVPKGCTDRRNISPEGCTGQRRTRPQEAQKGSKPLRGLPLPQAGSSRPAAVRA